MFRDSDVFKHEAYFADLLWNKIWEVYPKEFCNSFQGKTQIKITESTIIKREVKAKELDPTSRFPSSSYDYVVDLSALGLNRRLLFDLTTGLWKKSGFHEVGRTTEDYIEMWKELLFNIPQRIANAYAVWYVVVNSTEDRFFDETAPQGVRNMEALVDLVTSGDRKTTILVQSDNDLKYLNLNIHKLLVIPVFNSTPAKGEARREIKRLEEKRYDKLLIWKVVNLLIQ
jgi:hypothetical protein